MFDLHRHDEYSTFDGYGKATELAALAKVFKHDKSWQYKWIDSNLYGM